MKLKLQKLRLPDRISLQALMLIVAAVAPLLSVPHMPCTCLCSC